MKKLTALVIIVLSFLQIQSSSTSNGYRSDAEIVAFIANPTVQKYIAQCRFIEKVGRHILCVPAQLDANPEQAKRTFEKYAEASAQGAAIYREFDSSQRTMLFAIEYQEQQNITHIYSGSIEERKQIALLIHHGTSTKKSIKNGTFR